MNSTFVSSNDDTSNFRRIGQGFCGSVWAAEKGMLAMKREDGGPGRSLLNDYKMHKVVLDSVLQQEKVKVCVPQWPEFVKTEDLWWDGNLTRFPKGYSACNMLRSERIPLLPQTVRNRLIDRYCPQASILLIKNNDADRDCLVRLYLGRRKIQNESRRNFFSLRNYPLHLNQAEELNIQISDYARAMAEMLAILHWTAKIDANDVEFVIGGVQKTGEFANSFFGDHCLWMLDFDCCRPLTMDETGINRAACAFLRNDPYFPRPAAEDSPDYNLWQEFRTHYLESSRTQAKISGIDDFKLPKQFLERVEALTAMSVL